MEGMVKGERGREEGRGQIREDRGLATRQVGTVGKSASRQVVVDANRRPLSVVGQPPRGRPGGDNFAIHKLCVSFRPP